VKLIKTVTRNRNGSNNVRDGGEPAPNISYRGIHGTPIPDSTGIRILTKPDWWICEVKVKE
jgi:hypothetical protein